MADLIHVNQNAESIDARHERQRAAESIDAKHKYRFAEDGFRKATEAAIEIARSRHILAAEDENVRVMTAGNPSSVVRSIDGVDNASDDAFKL